VLNEAFTALTSPGPNQTSTQQAELAGRLGADEKSESLHSWLAKQSSPDKVASRLDALLAELNATEDSEVAGAFQVRANAIAAEASAGQRALLTDSLVLELSARAQQRRDRANLVDQLRELRARLSVVAAPEGRSLETSIEDMLKSKNFNGAESVLAHGKVLVESEMAKLAAASRRRAVLQGLAQLGYEVRDSMQTGWVRDGRLVVTKPNALDYGVELASPPDASRLQVRLVGSDRPASARSARRDRDMETLWCAEFGQLRDLLASHGAEMVVESAFEPGVQPVKTVDLPGTPEVEIAATPQQRSRHE